MRNAWKVMLHHEDPAAALNWVQTRRRIAVGWGQIGDLRRLPPASTREIASRIRREYPDLTNASLGGPSLWNLFAEMAPGDLVIVAGNRRRWHVVEVTGPYLWVGESGALGDYQHQREVKFTSLCPDVLWRDLGSRAAAGQSTRWSVARLAPVTSDEPEESSLGPYVEGARCEIKSSRIERSEPARRACLDHHGCRCLACGLDFEERYGEIGRGFIHVHHLKPMAEAESERQVDPKVDLVPLCPNCHAMAHRRQPPFDVTELKALLAASGFVLGM